MHTIDALDYAAFKIVLLFPFIWTIAANTCLNNSRLASLSRPTLLKIKKKLAHLEEPNGTKVIFVMSGDFIKIKKSAHLKEFKVSFWGKLAL